MIEVVAGALWVPNGKDRLYFIGERSGRAFYGALEFPGGKVNPGESHEDALIREWSEELPVFKNVRVGERVATLTFDYPALDESLRITLYRVTADFAPADVPGDELPAHSKLLFVSLDDLSHMGPFTPSTVAFIYALKGSDSVEALASGARVG